MKPASKIAALAEVKRLLKQPYSRNFVPDDDGGFTAEIVEFDGCIAEGDTAAEAHANLESAAESWLLACLERGQEIPKPIINHEASGRFLLRLPRGTYHRATKAAALEGTSLNAFIASAVSERLGGVLASKRIEELIVRRMSPGVTFVMPETADTASGTFSGERFMRNAQNEHVAANESRLLKVKN